MPFDDLFKLVPGPAHFSTRTGLAFSTPRTRHGHPQYQFHSDPEKVEYLENKDCIEKVDGDRLEDVLGGSADEAAEKITAGEVDEILDFVLFAERETENRAGVIQAVQSRNSELASQDDITISTTDIVTAG